MVDEKTLKGWKKDWRNSRRRVRPSLTFLAILWPVVILLRVKLELPWVWVCVFLIPPTLMTAADAWIARSLGRKIREAEAEAEAARSAAPRPPRAAGAQRTLTRP
jgi:hypothetical protein